MIQFRNLAQCNENVLQRTRRRYLRNSTELARSKCPTGGERATPKFNRGDAMLDTSWRKPMFDATMYSDLTDNLSPCRLPEMRAGNPSDNDLQRAEGSCRIVLSGSESGTRVMDVFQRSPIRVMFPRIGGAAVNEAVLINTAGGIAGGDRLECGVTALADASIAVTSQAAEKVYRALNEPARITTKLKACEGAKLAWLPQETIVFNCARLSRETEIELSSGAQLLALSGLCWVVPHTVRRSLADK
jgi:UreD urease accessory protein